MSRSKRTTTTTTTPRESTPAVHREAAAEAGLGKVSVLSLLAGLVTAYGTFAVVAAIAGSLLAAANVETDFRTNDWTGSGAVAAITTAIVLLIAYLFGGYVAGRMARRSSVAHGVLLALATLVVGALAGGLVAALTDDASIRSNLRSIGVPTATSQITDVALAGLILSLVAIVAGSVLGAVLGERWHTKLARRIADPEVGVGADRRRQLAAEQEERDRRIAADPTVATTDRRHVDLAAEERAGATRADEPRWTEAEWRERERQSHLR